MNKKQLDLSIVIVNFNGKRLLKSCLESIYRETMGVDFEIFVVDNNSSDGSQAMVKKYFSDVKLIENFENMGFAKANNIAIAKSRGRNVLLLNPDTVVLSGAIQKMSDFMDRNPDASALGCKLLNEDETLQHSIGTFPTWTNQVAKVLYLYRILPFVRAFQEINTKKSDYKETGEVDWLFGAVMLVRREVIEKIGMFDEEYFLFSEEKDLCYRMKKDGHKIIYYSGAEIIHYGRGESTNSNVFTLLIRSNIIFFKKHFTPITYLSFSILTILHIFMGTFISGMASIMFLGKKKKNTAKFKLYGQSLIKLFSSVWSASSQGKA